MREKKDEVRMLRGTFREYLLELLVQIKTEVRERDLDILEAGLLAYFVAETGRREDSCVR